MAGRFFDALRAAATTGDRADLVDPAKYALQDLPRAALFGASAGILFGFGFETAARTAGGKVASILALVVLVIGLIWLARGQAPPEATREPIAGTS